MLLYLIRHGDPIYDPDSLTPLGQRQAEALAKRLNMYGVDKIFSSTSVRALLTAQPTSELCKKEIIQLDFCHESYALRDLYVITPDGNKEWAFRYPPSMQFFASREISALGDNWYDHPALHEYPYREGIRRIQDNADEFLSSLGYQHIRERRLYKAVLPNDEHVALFAHEGFGIAFLSCILDIPYPMFSIRLGLTHSSLTVIDFSDIDGYAIPMILTAGNDSHLYKEGIITGYLNGTRY